MHETHVFILQHKTTAELCNEIHTWLCRSAMLEIGLASFEMSTMFSTCWEIKQNSLKVYIEGLNQLTCKVAVFRTLTTP